MDNNLHRKLCKNYEQSALIMIKSMKNAKNDLSVDNGEAAKNYKQQLILLRKFLDEEGLKMPPSRWFYDPKDTSTWVFQPTNELDKKFRNLRKSKI